LYDANRYVEALGYFDTAIKLNPNYYLAYNFKGFTLSELGRHVEAIECYNNMLKLNSNDANAYYSKGEALYLLEKKTEALWYFDTAIKLNPNYYLAYNFKGLTLSNLGKHVEAIECYDIILKLNPNDANAYYSKGTSLYNLSKHKEAIESFDEAIKLNPADANAYNSKGIVLSVLKNNLEALECFDIAIQLNTQEAEFYCNKGRVLNTLGKEHEALECFNNGLECFNNGCEIISTHNNLGNQISQISQKHNKYIKETLSKDREELLKKLTELQTLSTEVSDAVKDLDQNNPAVKKAVEQFKAFTKQKTELTNKVIDSLDPSKASKDTSTHESIEALSKQMSDMKTEMQAFMQNMLIEMKQETKIIQKSQTNIHSDIKVGFVAVKENQQNQTSELVKHGKLLAANSKSIKLMQQATTEMKAKIASETKASDKDKQLMESKINAIAEKMRVLAKQEDVETITLEMAKLMSEAKITKGRLSDLEDDIDSLIERQDKTNERLAKLELFQQTVEEIKAKVAADGRLTQKDKEIMEGRINSITEKMQSLAKQEYVEAITQEMIKLMSEAKITKGRLSDLEDDVDSLIGKQEEPIEINIVSSILYNNPLLNHPTLLKDTAKHFGLSKALDLSHSLSTQLVEDAMSNNDSELILAGIMSLSLNNIH
jgi:tetratricopeptide (TPR) repeat protein